MRRGTRETGRGQSVGWVVFGIPFINNGQQEKGIRVGGCLVGIFARNVSGASKKKKKKIR